MRIIALIGVLIALVAYFVWPHDGGSSASHVKAAIEYHNEAARIGNKPGLIMASADAKQRLELYRKALAEAEQANIADMNKYHPGFGDHFRDEFIAGLRLIVNNYDSPVPQLQGQALEDRFGEWYQANLQR
jgi:hypothetical protein